MRIAFFVSELPTPSETFILSQIAGLIDRGHDVQIFGRKPERLPPEPLPVRYRLAERIHYYRSGATTLPTALTRSLRALGNDRGRALRSVGKLAAGKRPRSIKDAVSLWGCAAALVAAGPRFDAVIAHFGPNALLAQRMREIGALEGALLSVFHGRDASHAVRKYGRGYYDPVFAHSERVLPVSEYFARRLRELGCPDEKLLVHHMGVDLSRFELRERTLSAPGPVKLLSVCRLVEKKGMDYALQAAARVRDTGAAFEWQIIGEGPELAKLRGVVHQLGLEARVQLTGVASHDTVREALAAAHVFVAPSVTAMDGDEEGVPVAIMEAAAAGLPIVSTQHSGIPELVQHERSGLLSPERNVEALAANLITLIRSPERWAAMGKAGHAHVAAEYDVKQLDDRLVALAEQAARDYRAAR
jgi:colanic acid/amylovoran biosynthesis glycosyltransferase